MDLKFWIWLIAIVAMFLVRAMRKSPKTPESPARQPRTNSDDDDSPGNRPMSFEELLREIQQSKTPPKPEVSRPFNTRPPIRTAPPAKSYDVDYDDDIPEEEQDLETIPATWENRTSEVYESAKRDAFQRKSLEETMKRDDTNMQFIHFKGYDDVPKKNVANDVFKEISDPDGLKKAFILSEILQRKF
ncbi:MAG TPA: hypothetical protein VK508_07365 [Cyclobacteriaceae bacterium]|nr:hypothetical protein [Cyclobacteriaceae bacterium]